MTHDHILYDSDPHFIIDPESRKIDYSSNDDLVLVTGDHNSELFTFEIPAVIDGHNMTECNKVEVHYINIGSGGTINRSTGVYKVTDLHISEDNPEMAVFSWKVSCNATKHVGSLNFVVRFACTVGSRIDYAFNTTTYTGIPVLETYDNANTVVEQNADILEEWYLELISASTMGSNIIDEAKNEALNEIALYGGIMVSEEEPVIDAVKVWLDPSDGSAVLKIRNLTTGEFEPILSIKGEKGEPGGIANITHERGDSEDLVISQKGMTEIFMEIDDRIDEVEYVKLKALSDTISSHDTRIKSLADSHNGLAITSARHTQAIDDVNARIDTESARVDTSVETLRGDLIAEINGLKQRIAYLEGYHPKNT